MSGDVQPRKRKDKKRKKDELGVDEGPRGTAAALGEGDVFMHSPNEHGTGGHWCAKIIFFSLLAVLVTLIGLIILENRGLSELEANSVESRYSGVLEGWLEDAPDDDHHDEHTLELKHHDDEEADHDDHSPEIDHDDEEGDHEAEDNDHDEEDDENDDNNDANEIEDEDENHEANDDDDDDDDVEEVGNQEVDDQDDDDEHEDELYNDDDDDDEAGEQQQDDDDDEDQAGEQQQDDDDDDDEASEQQQDDDDDDDEAGEQQDDDDSAEQDLDKSNEDANNEAHDYGRNEESGEDEVDNAEDDDDLQKVDENDTAEDDEKNDETNDSVENDDADDDDDKDNSEEIEQDDNETRENEGRTSTTEYSISSSVTYEDGRAKRDGVLSRKLDEEEHEEEIEDLEVEIERLEKEVSDEDALSEELPAAEAEEDDKSDEISSELAPEDVADIDDDDDGAAEDEEFLEPDDIVEAIVAPKGKPLVEVEEETSTVKPADTLADEEEYEKQQAELRREQEQASHMWLKLVVGGALLVATHAVVRRFTAPRDDTAASDEHAIREETPVIARRMTLISEEEAAAAIPSEVVGEVDPVLEETLHENISSLLKSAKPQKEESEEEEVEDEEENEDEVVTDTKNEPAKEPVKDKELYSDDEEEEEEQIVNKVVKEPPKQSAPVQKAAEPVADDDVPEDVEIIDEEQIEEELEEEDDEEEEISDVDDAELLSRLEAKYGRLPEPERPGQKHKDGGNSIEDDWPGEPSDQYWRQQLDQAEEELRQGEWSAAGERAGAAPLRDSARARWLLARSVDAEAEARRDNRLLTKAITSYLDVLKMNERLTDNRLLEVAHRTLDRIRFRGNYLSAEPVYRLLIRRFPDVVDYHNNLTVSFLMANRVDLAEQVIKETLQKWPDDRFALAHHGFVLKTKYNRLEEAVDAFQKALEGDVGPATEPRFYYHLGDSLLLLGRFSKAHEVHKRGAALGHFLSPSQRSLYNVDRLKSQPWWNIEQTPYLNLARALEKSWKEILKEGETAKALYEQEKEGLKERGEWSQLDLFVRGQEVPNRCKRAPVTCAIVRSEAAAAGCKRGQVKFSAMEAGTHVRPHVGPTNCRLRMHLGLSNTKDTYIRVDQETRQWQVGKTLMFDDSFEHEVWHNGTGTRLVLIVDVWHPALTPHERRTLPPI